MRSLFAQGSRGVISLGTQGSDLTSLPLVSSSLTWRLLILEGSEEEASGEKEVGSSVSEGGGEHSLGVEGAPLFRFLLSCAPRVESLPSSDSGVLPVW